jgi:ferredoxin-type protein NapF
MQSTIAKTINRRQFLRGEIRGKTKSIRPPWALPENKFLENCSRCNKCIDKCPEKIIVKGDGGFPVINFEFGACTFCQDCVDVCDDAALSINNTEHPPWTLKAEITSECISLHGVTCRSCADSCEEESISFSYQLGGISQPEIDTKSCTGCGSCVATCPVTAIKVSEKKVCEEYAYDHN